jgi:hypothetical protein
MIHVLARRASESEIAEMLDALDSYVKLAVDISREILAGGGVMHADCESALIESGSKQEDVWGADWIPESGEVRFESLINIRPRQGNRSMTIQDDKIRGCVFQVVRHVFGEAS